MSIHTYRFQRPSPHSGLGRALSALLSASLAPRSTPASQPVRQRRFQMLSDGDSVRLPDGRLGIVADVVWAGTTERAKVLVGTGWMYLPSSQCVRLACAGVRS